MPALCQVLIVGGGIAGASLCYLLAKEGIEVTLLERKCLPRYKPCGGGLTPRAMAIMPLDIQEVVEDYCHKVEVRYKGRCLYQREYHEPMVTMVMRDRLDHYILDKARELRARICEGTHFRSFSVIGDEVVVHTSDRDIGTKVLVGADGAFSKVRRCMGLGLPEKWFWAAQVEVPLKNPGLLRFRGKAQFDLGFEASGYSWAFPKGNGISVGTCAAFGRVEGVKESLDSYLISLGLGDVGRNLPKRCHPIPFSPLPRNFPPYPIFLVGDALGLTDPATGEGMFYGLLTSKLAYEFIASFLTKQGVEVKGYWERVQREIWEDLKVAHGVAGLCYGSPRFFHILLAIFGRSMISQMEGIIRGALNYHGFKKNLIIRIIKRWGAIHERARHDKKKDIGFG